MLRGKVGCLRQKRVGCLRQPTLPLSIRTMAVNVLTQTMVVKIDENETIIEL